MSEMEDPRITAARALVVDLGPTHAAVVADLLAAVLALTAERDALDKVADEFSDESVGLVRQVDRLTAERDALAERQRQAADTLAERLMRHAGGRYHGDYDRGIRDGYVHAGEMLRALLTPEGS